MSKLQKHLKNFTVRQLKKEVVAVKRGFQVSRLKRAEVEAVILSYPDLFKHLLNKNPKAQKIKTKKPLPSTNVDKELDKQIKKMIDKPLKKPKKLSINVDTQPLKGYTKKVERPKPKQGFSISKVNFNKVAPDPAYYKQMSKNERKKSDQERMNYINARIDNIREQKVEFIIANGYKIMVDNGAYIVRNKKGKTVLITPDYKQAVNYVYDALTPNI